MRNRCGILQLLDLHCRGKYPNYVRFQPMQASFHPLSRFHPAKPLPGNRLDSFQLTRQLLLLQSLRGDQTNSYLLIFRLLHSPNCNQRSLRFFFLSYRSSHHSAQFFHCAANPAVPASLYRRCSSIYTQLNDSFVNFSMQCSLPSTIYWALALSPVILGNISAMKA